MIQVTTDGYLSFGRPVTCCPSLISRSSVSNYIIAPFDSNIDIEGGTGMVSYEVHNMTTSPGLLSKVNRHIQQSMQVRFSGIWMLVVEWNDVPQFGQTTGMVYYNVILYKYYIFSGFHIGGGGFLMVMLLPST